MVASYQGKLQEPTRERYPRVREFMSKSIVTLSPKTDIYQAMDLLLKHKITGAPVIDEMGCLVGIVSEKDCLRLATQDTYENTPHGGPVAAYMTTDVITISPEMGLGEVAQIFMKTPYKKLPVMREGKLVGVVRRHDVLAVIQDFYKKRMKYIKETSKS